MTDCPLCGAEFSAPSAACPECKARSGRPFPLRAPRPARLPHTYDPMTGLVIVVGVTMLAFALLPPLTARHSAVSHEQCRNNLKRIGAALHLYHDRYGTFPPACVTDAGGQPLYGWRVLILPFVGEQELFERFDLSQGWSAPQNRYVLEHLPDIYRCPSSPTAPADYSTHYAGVCGEGTVLEGTRPVHSLEVRDGLSRTLMVVEAVNSKFPWTSPQDVDGTMGFRVNTLHGASSHHAGGAHVLTVDEGVHFLTDEVAPSIVRQMCHRDDGGGIDVNGPEAMVVRSGAP